MKKLLTVCLFLCSLCTYSQLYSDWSFNPKNVNVMGGYIEGIVTRTDTTGNVYVTGDLSGTGDFDPGPGVYNLTSAGYSRFISKYNSSGALVYAKCIGGPTSKWDGTGPSGYMELDVDLAVDNAGNAYLTGYFAGTVEFDLGSGGAALTADSLADIYIAKYDPSGAVVYAKRIGATGRDRPGALVLDGLGNIYLTGHFEKTVDFDPGPGVVNLSASTTNYALFIAKYDNSANLIFAKVINGNASGASHGIALDGSGNIYISGSFGAAYDFDPGAGVVNLPNNGLDMFFAKYDPAGNYVFAKSIVQQAFSGSTIERAYEIQVDNTGNIYLAGTFQSNVDFDPGAGVAYLNAFSAYAVFFAKYDASGNYVFAHPIISYGADQCFSMTIDPSANIYLGGLISGTADFDPGPGTANLTATANDGFVAKYDAAGNYIFAGLTAHVCGIALDTALNISVTGLFNTTCDFDLTAGVVNMTSPSFSAFVSKHDPAFGLVWAGKLGGYGGTAENEIGTVLKRDNFGYLYTLGTFQGSVDFDPSSGTTVLTAAGATNRYFCKYDSTGNLVFALNIGSSASVNANSIALDNSGNIFISGSFSGTVDFDPGAGTANLISISSSQDVFVVKLDASGSYQFAQQIGGTGYAISAAGLIDNAGDFCLVGNFLGTVDFDPGAGTATLVSMAASTNMFIAKYTSSGAYVFANKIGGSTGFDEVQSLSTDASGNIYFCGKFSGTVDFDAGAGISNVTVSGSGNMFFCKYTSTGNFVYVSTIQKSSGLGSGIMQIFADSAGTVYLKGGVNGTFDFDPSPSNYNLTSAYGNDIFISKYDFAGNLVFAKLLEGTLFCDWNTFFVDPYSNIYLTGAYTGIPDFDPSLAVALQVTSGYKDIFVAKYDSTGSYIFSQSFGESVTDDGSNAIAVSPTGKVYITGYFHETMDMDASAGIQYLQSLNSKDAFLAGFLPSTDFVWPGDADHDNVVTNADLLPIGLYYSQTGPPRASISNLWQAYSATNWGTSMPGGVDIKNVDCDGNGTIDANDTLAVNANFSLIHAFAPNDADERITDPDLYFSSSSSTYLPGSWVDLDIMAGSSSLPLTALYGIAFNINFNSSMVVPGSESIVYPASWFATPGVDAIKISKSAYSANTMHGAETRIDQTNASGFGKIATFRFQVKPTIGSITPMNFSITSYSANDATANPVSMNPQNYLVTVDPFATSVMTTGEKFINISPNPADGLFKFDGLTENTSVIIYDQLGQVVSEYQRCNSSQLIDLSDFSKGIYIYRIFDDNGEVQNGKLVLQ